MSGTTPSRGTHPSESVAPRTSARERLLDAAEELFAEHGFAATTTRAITERAGTSAGAFFYHFPSKESVLEAVLDERNPEDQVEGILAAHAGDVRAGLTAVAEHLLELLETKRPMLLLIIRGEEPIPRHLLEERFATALDLIGGYLVRCLDDRLSRDRGHTMALMFMTSIVLTELLLPSADPNARARDVIDVLLHGRET